MLGSFGWTKNNDGSWDTTVWLWKWPFCPVKQYMHALRSHFGHRPLLVLLPANSILRLFCVVLMEHICQLIISGRQSFLRMRWSVPCVWYNADIPEVYQCTWEATHTGTWNITSITIQTSFSRWFSLHKWFDLTPFSSGVEYIVDLVVGASVHSKNWSGMMIDLIKLFWLNEKE